MRSKPCPNRSFSCWQHCRNALRARSIGLPPMHSMRPTGTTTAPATSKRAPMSSVKTNVYSSSRKPMSSANGNGRAQLTAVEEAPVTVEARTVIHSEEQVQLMNNNVVPATGLVTIPVQTKDKVFECPEESLFYCQSIESLVLNRPDCPRSLVEFGAGDGSPVISALLKSTKAPGAMPTINAYEIGASAAQLATARAASVGLGDVYRVHNGCFWKGAVQDGKPEDKCLIANPPYIPAPDSSKLLMPALWGGVDGANLTRDLLSAGFGSTMLLISAYSNPVKTLQHARDQGYYVADFLVQPLPFGTYSSQDVVRSHLQEMREKGEAFYRDTGAGRRPYYFLAGVLFKRAGEGEEVEDLSEELLSVMCAL